LLKRFNDSPIVPQEKIDFGYILQNRAYRQINITRLPTFAFKHTKAVNILIQGAPCGCKIRRLLLKWPCGCCTAGRAAFGY